MAIQTEATRGGTPTGAEKLATDLSARLAGPIARAVIRRHLIALKRHRRGKKGTPC